MKRARKTGWKLAPVAVAVALLVAGVATSQDEPEIQETLFFESVVGEVVFPHQAHFDDLEIECETCHHEHNAARLDFPHPQYFEDFWIDCGICHHPSETPQVAQACDSCHYCPIDCADETLSPKVVIHKNCWQCHEKGTGAEASEACVFCHTGPKREW